MNHLLFLPILLVALLLCLGCQDPDEDYPPRDRAVNEAVFRTAAKLAKKHNVGVAGFGGGINHDTGKQNHISMSLEKRKIVSKEEGRRLLVDSVSELLATINSDKALVQYIEPVPFEVKNVTVSMSVLDAVGDFVFHPNIAMISCNDGIVKYATNDPEKDYLYKAIVKESYEDAVKKVSTNQETTDLKQAPEDDVLDKVADEASKIFSDRYKLLTTEYEAWNDRHNKINKIAFDVETRYLVDIDEARKLIFNCVDDIVFLVNSNKSFAEYFTPLPFTEEGVTLNLRVFDENGKQHKHPVLWSIRFANGEIVYSTCYERYPPPDNAIVSETLKEARQKLGHR